MPAHQRTKSSHRSSSSLSLSSPPLAFRPSNAAREKARRTPIASSARRKNAPESLDETSASRHLQAALALLPANGNSRRSPPKLGSPITLRSGKPTTSSAAIKEDEDEEMFLIHPRPEEFNVPRDELYASLEARAFDWRQDPFEASPVYVHGQRPNYKHKHKRTSSSSYATTTSLLYPPSLPPLRVQPTLLSATPSPAISAANSPAPTPLTLGSDLDLSLLLPHPSTPQGCPAPWAFDNAASAGLLSTPALSTPGLSPSASSTTGSPFVQIYDSEDYLALLTPGVHRTPRTPRPVPD